MGLSAFNNQGRQKIKHLPKLSHLTRDAYHNTWSVFGGFLSENNYQLNDLDQVRERHIIAFVTKEIEDKKNLRTICNEVSHLRNILPIFARCKSRDGQNPLSNDALEISGKSRKGTNVAIPFSDIITHTEKFFQLERRGFAAALGLEYTFGLRRNEAINADADILSTWIKEIESGRGYLHVWKGTKGGRRRDVYIIDKEEALLVLHFALKIAVKQGQYLIVSADGSCGNLKKAVSIYRSAMGRAGISGHGARYSFAVNRCNQYIAEGNSVKHALALTSKDLGHGDGRGAYIASTYYQGVRQLKGLSQHGIGKLVSSVTAGGLSYDASAPISHWKDLLSRP